MPYPSNDTATAVVERNIAALLAHQQRHERRRSTGERIADAIGRFAGSLWSVYLHAGLFGG